MKKIKLLLITVLVTLFFVGCDDLKLSDKKPKTELELTSLEYNDKNDISDYSIKIPQIVKGDSEDIVYFNLTMQENMRYIIDNLSTAKGDGQIESAYINYDEYPNNFNIVSIGLLTSIYTGGAHPQNTFETYNINKKDNSLLTFDKLFTEQDVEYFNMLINDQIKNHNTIYNTQGNEAVLFDDAEVNIRNSAFYFDNNNIVFVFQQYELGPYSSGMPVFKFDKSLIKNHLHLDK